MQLQTCLKEDQQIEKKQKSLKLADKMVQFAGNQLKQGQYIQSREIIQSTLKIIDKQNYEDCPSPLQRIRCGIQLRATQTLDEIAEQLAIRRKQRKKTISYSTIQKEKEITISQ